MGRVIAIDPGPTESAVVLWDGEKIISSCDMPNENIVEALAEWDEAIPEWDTERPLDTDYVCAIEQLRGFGVLASDAIFDTCWWSGRFAQAFGMKRTHMIPRKKAAAHICGTGGISKDQFVREAIIQRFGGKEKAVGSKKSPGILYGISSHKWAALCIALYYWDVVRTQKQKEIS